MKPLFWGFVVRMSCRSPIWTACNIQNNKQNFRKNLSKSRNTNFQVFADNWELESEYLLMSTRSWAADLSWATTAAEARTTSGLLWARKWAPWRRRGAAAAVAVAGKDNKSKAASNRRGCYYQQLVLFLQSTTAAAGLAAQLRRTSIALLYVAQWFMHID